MGGLWGASRIQDPLFGVGGLEDFCLWTAFCSQMGTQWGSIFGPGLTSTASLANLARSEKEVKNTDFQNLPKTRKSGPILNLYKDLYYFLHPLMWRRCAKLRFWGASKNQEFPKRDPWGVQVRPKRHKTGGVKKSIHRFVGELSAKRKTANGGETEAFSKAVHVAFAQGLLVFFENESQNKTPEMEHLSWRISVFWAQTGSILGPSFFHFRPLGSPKRVPRT